MRFAIQLLVIIAAFATAGVVRAQDEALVQEWPRFHIGVAAGSSDISQDYGSLGIPEDWPQDTSTTGRKAVAGFRPARVVGVELQFVDFGEGDIDIGRRTSSVHIENSANAWVLSALLFIPEPVPWVDVYGKVGVAVLDEAFFAAGYTAGYEPGCGRIYCRVDINQTESRPYIGIGARFKVSLAWAVRVEYEAIDHDVGDNTTMFSLGIAWEQILSR